MKITSNRDTQWPDVIEFTKEELDHFREIGKQRCLLWYGFYIVEPGPAREQPNRGGLAAMRARAGSFWRGDEV